MESGLEGPRDDAGEGVTAGEEREGEAAATEREDGDGVVAGAGAEPRREDGPR